MGVHIVWVIISKDGKVYNTKEDVMCCYPSYKAGILAMADFMNKYPEKEFFLKETKLQLPWM